MTIASSADDNGDFEQPIVFDEDGVFSNQHRAIETKEDDDLFEHKSFSKRFEYSTSARKRGTPLQFKPMKYPCSLCGKVLCRETIHSNVFTLTGLRIGVECSRTS